MSYIFNKINLAIVIVMVFLIAMSMNEVAKYAKKVNLSNKAAYAQWFRNQKAVFQTQDDCQKTTKSICSYETCDAVPQGDSIEEICGDRARKGWRPTNVPIPESYQDISIIQISIGTKSSRSTLEILPHEATMRYIPRGVSEQKSQIKKIDGETLTLLTNKLVSYEFIRLSDMLKNEVPDPATPIYNITMISTEMTADGQSESKTHTAACPVASCPRSIVDLKNDILRLWGEPIPESL